MHSRLPHFAGAAGTSAAAALTAALLITGCTPNPFGSPEAGLEPVSAAHAAPAAAQHSAQSTMAEAASTLAHRLQQAKPQGLVAASSGAQDTESEGATEPKQEDGSGVERHRDDVNTWSDSLTEAQEAAAEQRRAEAEAAERRQAEVEEAERQRAAEEAEPEPEPEPEDLPGSGEHVTDPKAEESHHPAPAPDLKESLSTPADPQVQFTGDMNAYLQDLAAAHPGSISISLQELTGAQRSASAGGQNTRVTASTYKLYVAYSIIRQVESGAMDWTDSVSEGHDLAQCFRDMIVVSNNPCPEAIGPEIGWGTIYSDAAAAGAGRTGQGEGAIVTSPNDLRSMLVRLETGQLSMSEAGHNRLREALGANVHRLGIPAGSAGQVLNKPGWIDGYVHDAAIVRHPQGTYVLSIMSEGSSWGSLASITSGVETALYGG
ncbi:MAG: serine hydrolase [Nesterenkonia sp.]